ncbi:MAG TPA: helix-turn-helix domain-containing protein [Arthrobacter sp.]|jgi:AcrR family transcriptional regulator
MAVQIDGGATPRSRVVAAARALFLERGVHATSLQMIADRIGVTKAAVYFQFRSKDEIVRAVIAPAIARITEMVTVAEQEQSAARRFELALDGLVGVVIEQGEVAAMLRRDAEVSELVGEDPEFRGLMTRLDGLLIGPKPSQDAKVTLALAGGGLMAVGSDPTWKQLHPDGLRRILHEAVERALGPYRPQD